MNKINHIVCSHCHLINDIKKTQSQNNLKCFPSFLMADDSEKEFKNISSEPSSSNNIIGLFNSITDCPNTTDDKCLSFCQVKRCNTALISNSTNCISFDIEDDVEKSNVIYKTNSSVATYITIDLLLKKIAIDDYYSSNCDLMNSFIDQFHCFMSVTIMIQKCMLAFDQISKRINKIPIDLLLFLYQIIQKHYSDIKQDLNLTEAIYTFYNNLQQASNINLPVKQLINNTMIVMSSINIEKTNSSQMLNKIKDSDKSLNSIYQRKDSNTQIVCFDIFEHKETDLAIQMTNITNRLISNIKPREFLFLGENKEIKAPNLSQLIQRSNKLTLFIIEDICSYDHKKTRSKVIEKYIFIANELKKLNNFNDLLIIVSAINHMIIQKTLVNTWNNVDTKYKSILIELKHFVSFEELYKNIRNTIDKLKSNHTDFTPYVGITLKKLSFLDEGNHYIKDKRFINFEKIHLVNQVINEFSEYNKSLSNYQYNNKLSILDNINPKTEKELLVLAKLLEPTFCLMKKKSTSKRVTKTENTIKSPLNVD